MSTETQAGGWVSDLSQNWLRIGTDSVSCLCLSLSDAPVPELEHSVNSQVNCVVASKLKLEVRRGVEKEPGQILHRHVTGQRLLNSLFMTVLAI